MRIQNNIAAENSHRQLGINNSNISKNTEKLSSGFRVNRAADDAAGLAISEKMRTQIRGLNRASLNIQDGVSLLQVGDGALQSIHDKLQRLRELAVQAANDTNQLIDREAIQLEFGELANEANQVVSMTNFNGKFLFDGTVGASYEYNLGKIESPFITTIPAGDVFGDSGAVNIEGWQAGPMFGVSTPVNATLWTDSFPSNGIFTMQIVTPANGTLNVILDFATVYKSTPGDLGLNDILTYFRDEFNNLGLGPVVNEIRYENIAGIPRFIFDFPKEGDTLLGVMGQPSAATTNTTPRVFVGLGAGIPGTGGTNGTNAQRDSLNGTSTSWTSPPFRTNRPDLTITSSEPTFRNDSFFSNNNVITLPSGANLPTVPPGGFRTMTLTVGGTPTTINFIPGNYPSVQEFVAAHKSIFAQAMPQAFDLDVDDGTPPKLVITAKGSNPPPIAVSVATNPTDLRDLLGFDASPDSTTEPLSGGLIIQSGANQGDEVIISMPNLNTRALGLSIWRPQDEGTDVDHINGLGADGYSTKANIAGDPMEYSLDVTSHETASAALSVLTNAINIISMERAQIGAQQNRLEFAMKNADNTSENLQAAESRIRDVDMAAEMTTFVQNQILVQSSTAMLAQANALPNGVLQLLG